MKLESPSSLPSTGTSFLAHSPRDIAPIASGPLALGLLAWMHFWMHPSSKVQNSCTPIMVAMATYTVAFLAQVYAYHFHAHTLFFRSAILNRTLDVLYSVVNGEPHSFYAYQHLRHHDRAVLAKEVKYNRFGPLRGALSASGLLNPLFYAQQLDCFRAYWIWALFATRNHGRNRAAGGRAEARDALSGKYSWHRKRSDALDALEARPSPLLPPYVIEWAFLGRNRGYVRILIAEIAAIVGVRFTLALLAPRFFFLVYVPFTVLLFAVRNYTDFVDHFGADLGSKASNAVSCYGAVFNFLTFNSGYHLEHHWSPGLHWSKYPQLRPKMLPENERRVIPWHLWLNPFFSVRPPGSPNVPS